MAKQTLTHWTIEVFDNNDDRYRVKSSYFDGTAIKAHIKNEFRKKRPNAASGSQLYFPASRYSIKVSAYMD